MNATKITWMHAARFLADWWELTIAERRAAEDAAPAGLNEDSEPEFFVTNKEVLAVIRCRHAAAVAA